MTDRDELTVLSLSHDMPRGWEGSWAHYPAGPLRAWLVVSADGGASRFEHPIGKAMFWRSDAEYEAGFLASELDEWICLGTTFGWGGGRGLTDYEVPAAVWPAGRVLEVYPAEEVSLPLWERGRQVPADELGLPDDLVAALIGWHQHLDHVSSVMDEAEPPPHVFTDPYAQRKHAEATLRAAGYTSWREYVDVFEAWRDELIERLRTELGPSFTVPTPPRIP